MKKINIIYKIMISLVLTLVIINVFMGEKAYASSLHTEASSATVTQGDKVTVKITLSADEEIGGVSFSVTYDKSILEVESLNGGESTASGSILFYLDHVGYVKTATYEITFKAIGVGNTTIDITEIVVPSTYNKTNFDKATYSSGTVTVNAPAAASTNNYLSSLLVSAVFENGKTYQMTLAPAFSKDELSYYLSVGGDVKRLAVSAKAEDGKAKVASWGTTLNEGKNTTTIAVTAEDGSVRTYKIYTEKAPTEVPTEAPTEAPTEEPPVDESRKVNISDKTFIISDVTDETVLPEGFEKTMVTYNGMEISAATDLSNTLTLFYMINEETKEHFFFIYNLADNTFLPFLSYTITQRSYILLMVEDDFYYNNEAAINSKNLELTSLAIANGYVDAYKIRNTESIYIVRAMNWNNEIHYYYYNIEDGSMIPYFNTDTSEKDADELQDVIATEHDAFEKRIDKRNIVIYLLGGIVVVMFGVLAVMLYKDIKRNKKSVMDDEIIPELALTDEVEEDVNIDKCKEDIEEKIEANLTEEIGEISEELVPKEELIPEEVVLEEEMVSEEELVSTIETDNEVEKDELIEATEEISDNEEEPMKEEEIDKAIEDILENLFK